MRKREHYKPTKFKLPSSHYDKDAADRTVTFISLLKHTKGEWYGGLENLGDKLMKAENFEMALGEIIWLITLLANQPLLIHNLKNKNDTKELLTEEEVELLTSPLDLAEYKDAITDALLKATKRNVESEADSKNPEAG